MFHLGEDYSSRRHHHSPCDVIDDRMDFDSCDPCCDKDDDWDLWSWLPILLIVFLLSGGFGLFRGIGGNNCRNDCCDGNEGGGSWLLIIVVIILLFNQGDGKKGGFLGGLF